MSVHVDIIANKKENKYWLVMITNVVLFLLGLSFLILDYIFLGFSFMIVSFLTLQIFHFYNGRIKIGVLILTTHEIIISSINDNDLHFSFESIYSITLYKSKTFDDFSLILAWGDGTKNILKIKLIDDRCINLRMYLKSKKQLSNMIYLLKKISQKGLEVKIKHYDSKITKLNNSQILNRFDDIEKQDNPPNELVE